MFICNVHFAQNITHATFGAQRGSLAASQGWEVSHFMSDKCCALHTRDELLLFYVSWIFFSKCSTVVTYYSGYLIIWAAEKPYKLIDILGKGLMAALSMESWTDRLLQSCSRKRAPVSVGEEFQKCVLSCHPHRTQGPMGLTHASDGCDIYGPACISFMERQLLG